MNSKSIPSLRRTGLEARRRLHSATREIASARITERVLRSHEFHSARVIACYLPMPDEVDPGRVISRAWQMRKQVCAPVIGQAGEMHFVKLTPETRLSRTRFGLWEPEGGEPVASRSIDLVITPLVAFDDDCGRIGMGGGYFDRAFAFLKRRRQWRRPKLLGVAFACQAVEKIQLNPWDIRLYAVATESRWIRCGTSRASMP
jgi:5-formyltetrahydrofolate cyclo-ligase